MTDNTRAQIGKVISFSWGTSRGRDTYGYNICTAKLDGRKVGQCSGGGYDMKGTALAEWMGRAFEAELLELSRKRAGSSYKPGKDGKAVSKQHTSRFDRGNAGEYVKNPFYRKDGLPGLTYYAADSFKAGTPEHASVDGGVGFRSMEEILAALGLSLVYRATSKKDGVYIIEERKDR